MKIELLMQRTKCWHFMNVKSHEKTGVLESQWTQGQVGFHWLNYPVLLLSNPLGCSMIWYMIDSAMTLYPVPFPQIFSFSHSKETTLPSTDMQEFCFLLNRKDRIVWYLLSEPLFIFFYSCWCCSFTARHIDGMQLWGSCVQPWVHPTVESWTLQGFNVSMLHRQFHF